MRGTCRCCGTKYLYKPSRWEPNLCPMCFIVGLEKADADWVAGDDHVDWARPSKDEYYYVLSVDGKLRLYSLRQYEKLQGRYFVSCRGTLSRCLNYLKTWKSSPK